jgi:hypothetical protein
MNDRTITRPRLSEAALRHYLCLRFVAPNRRASDPHRRFGPSACKSNQGLFLLCGAGSLGPAKGFFGVLPELIGFRHRTSRPSNPVPATSYYAVFGQSFVDQPRRLYRQWTITQRVTSLAVCRSVFRVQRASLQSQFGGHIASEIEQASATQRGVYLAWSPRTYSHDMQLGHRSRGISQAQQSGGGDNGAVDELSLTSKVPRGVYSADATLGWAPVRRGRRAPAPTSTTVVLPTRERMDPAVANCASPRARRYW